MKLEGKTQAQIDAKTAQAALGAEETELLTLLSTTDWYATRYAETGEAIPDTVKAERQAARERISAIRCS